ncbi:MAG TPA: RHS repeat domain-containing protein, partial [Waddliaceae bacterium]
QYADGTEERYEYTRRGNLSKSIDKEGTITLYNYDYLDRPCVTDVYANGELLKRTIKEYNAFHLTKEIDAEGVATLYTYDSAGRLSRIEKEERKIDILYDSLSRETEKREYFGYGEQEYIRRISLYNLLDEIICKRTEDASGTILEQVEYEYDGDGNRIEVRKDQAVTRTFYDPEGKELLSIDPLGKETKTFTIKALSIPMVGAFVA